MRYRPVQQPACSHPARLLATHAMICLPSGRSPAPAPDPLRVAAGLRSTIGWP
jgi:hypothetical protein